MKRKIALLAGGYTGEAEVSYRSAAFVAQNLDTSLYDVYQIHITKEDWVCIGLAGGPRPVNRDDFTITLDGERMAFDLAFIMIHGSPGEDGLLQGYFDMISVPYTSCGTLTSALTMNKAFTKALLEGISGVHLAPSVLLKEGDRSADVEKLVENLRLPYFVKPNAGGSSIGMSKVNDTQDLRKALDLAFNTVGTGREVIIEEFVAGREFSVGIYRRNGKLVVLPATEVIPKNDFFDYEAKYKPGMAQEITPAELQAGQREKIADVVKKIYERLNCKGMVRIDFFLESGSDDFYFIEINTIPGQTATSFIPQQVRAAGLSEKEFYSQLIEEEIAMLA